MEELINALRVLGMTIGYTRDNIKSFIEYVKEGHRKLNPNCAKSDCLFHSGIDEEWLDQLNASAHLLMAFLKGLGYPIENISDKSMWN